MFIEPMVEVALIMGTSTLAASGVPIILFRMRARQERRNRLRLEMMGAQTVAAAQAAEAAIVDQGRQIAQIHILVNSNLTTVIKSELAQTRITLVMMRKNIALLAEANRKPSPEELAAVCATEEHIGELQRIIADR